MIMVLMQLTRQVKLSSMCILATAQQLAKWGISPLGNFILGSVIGTFLPLFTIIVQIYCDTKRPEGFLLIHDRPMLLKKSTISSNFKQARNRPFATVGDITDNF